MKTLTVTGLARALGLSREHVSRHYKGWGFVPVPWSTPARPRFLAAHVDLFNKGGKDALTAVTPEPEDLDMMRRLARGAADAADKGIPWDGEPAKP